MRNLLQNDDEWQRIMAEAALTSMPSQLRHLYALICVFNSPRDPVDLYQQFENQLSEDFAMRDNVEIAGQKVLRDIDFTLRAHGLCCRDLGLPVNLDLIHQADDPIENERVVPKRSLCH